MREYFTQNRSGWIEWLHEYEDEVYEQHKVCAICDRCKEPFLIEKDYEERIGWWGLFKGTSFRKIMELLNSDFCPKCADYVRPHVHSLADIWYLQQSINKLERAIRERYRNQNNRPSKNCAGKCCQGRPKWKP